MNAIITGATKGIGRAVVNELAAIGYNIYACSRNQMELDAMKSEIETKFPSVSVFVFKADLSDQKQTKSFASFVLDSIDSIDVLVNNAGLFIPGAIHEENEGNLELMMKTNLYSAYILTKALLPNMINSAKGHIFNMCSIASVIAYPNGGSYSISKFALLGFSKVLREELKDKGIKVTAIMPGATWSNSWAGVELPPERLMQPEDISMALSAALKMGPSANVEEIIIRPMLGDL
jgi:short-subunit dehydrogenase